MTTPHLPPSARSAPPASDAVRSVADAPPVRVSREECPSPHSTANKLGRVAWAIVWRTLFRPSPRLLFGWRRMILRAFGADVAKTARVYPSAAIWAPWNLSLGEDATIADAVDCYCVAPIALGDGATVSQHAHLCAASHDIADPNMRLTTAPIAIGAGAWVCAGAFVGPGVTLGAGAVVGARGVVVRDVEPMAIVAGNPARVIGQRQIGAREVNEGDRETPA